MQQKVSYGDMKMTFDPKNREVTLYNGVPTVGQGKEGNTDAEILKSALINLYNKCDARKGGLFKYFAPLRDAFLTLANDMCKQVGTEPIKFDSKDIE